MARTMRFQAVLLALCGVLCFARSEFCFPARNQITQKQGVITDSALWRGPGCNHTWIFSNLPNNSTMLVLNITKEPILMDMLKLYGDDFLDDSKYKYCKILEHKSRTFETYSDTSQAETIHRKYPSCKLRSGVQPPVTLTFVGSPNRLVMPKFAIAYKAVPVNPEATSQATATKTTTTSETSTTTTGNRATSKTPSITIILSLLGGIVIVLALLLVTAVILRKRRMKHTLSKDQAQLNNFYQNMVEDYSSGATDGQMYNEIPAKKPSKRVNTEQGEISGRQESVKNVINPLYDNHAVNKHSYEYIDIKLPFEREEERSAV